MNEMEEKIGAILNNPQMMQQIMSMAQAMNAPTSHSEPQTPPTADLGPQIDMAMLQKLSGIARQSGIDKREQALLGALGAYLSGERIRRLEKAMRAAKMAKMASGLIGPRGLSAFGR